MKLYLVGIGYIDDWGNNVTFVENCKAYKKFIVDSEEKANALINELVEKDLTDDDYDLNEYRINYDEHYTYVGEDHTIGIITIQRFDEDEQEFDEESESYIYYWTLIEV